jgi:hypothetical protein
VSGEALFHCRNPWGGTEWGGAWRDDDAERWTTDAIGECNADALNGGVYAKVEDGTFFISVADFCDKFKGVNTCVIPDAGAVVPGAGAGRRRARDDADAAFAGRFAYQAGYLAGGHDIGLAGARMTLAEAMRLAASVTPAAVGLTWNGARHPTGAVGVWVKDAACDRRSTGGAGWHSLMLRAPVISEAADDVDVSGAAATL